jgi:uncharacterized protein YecE (DUF72 family)
MQTENLVTSPKLTYLRLHGRNERGYIAGKSVAERFNYDYSDDEIAGVATRVGRLAEEAEEVHVVFNDITRYTRPRPLFGLNSLWVLPERPSSRISCKIGISILMLVDEL